METALAILVYVLIVVSFLFPLSLPLMNLWRRKSLSGGERCQTKSTEVAKLPPGSMGWPFIGETLQLYSQDPNVFFASRQKRHGEILKTRILGCPCVMLAGPEAARFVLVTEAHLFKPAYPKSKERLIGARALFFHRGEYHALIRRLVQGSFSPDAIRNLVPDIGCVVVSALHSFAGGHVVNTFHQMKKISFEVGVRAIFGRLDAHFQKELEENYAVLDKGYNSFPTNIPGTDYRSALLARRRLSKILGEIVRERKEERRLLENHEKDLLSSLLSSSSNCEDNGESLTEDQIADNIIGALFAAQDTTASVMTWIIKYLHDEKKLLDDVKAEQKAIRKSTNGGTLSWDKTRNMPITSKVVLESLRMASIIPFAFREAVADVEYKGYLIPRGWKVMPLFRNIHHNPEFFTDPQKFDPSRFEVAPKPYTFMPFGSGAHACPGNELAKLEMLILIHHLVTEFRWEVVGSKSGTQCSPFPVPMGGLPARFWKESTL